MSAQSLLVRDLPQSQDEVTRSENFIGAVGPLFATAEDESDAGFDPI